MKCPNDPRKWDYRKLADRNNWQGKSAGKTAPQQARSLHSKKMSTLPAEKTPRKLYKKRLQKGGKWTRTIPNSLRYLLEGSQESRAPAVLWEGPAIRQKNHA